MNDNSNLNDSENVIVNYKEYNIKKENIDYNLRIEIDQHFIYFILFKLNEPLVFIYKNKMSLLAIINKLKLNVSKYKNLELLLKIMDNLNKSNNILININDDSYNLYFKLTNDYGEEYTSEIKLNKEYMNNTDKFNILYSYIKNINNKGEENKEIKVLKNKINELNKKINELEKVINEALIDKDYIIKNMNEKLNQEKYIRQTENKLLKNNLKNDINKRNELKYFLF